MDYWSSESDDDQDIAEWLTQSYEQATADAEVVGITTGDDEAAS